MTTTPRPIAALDAELEKPSVDQPINTHLQLAVALQTASGFRSFTINTPNDDVIVITRDGLIQILLGSNVWQSISDFQVYLQQASSDTSICLVCTGTHSELASLPEYISNSPDIQLLGLPLHPSALYPIVHNIYNMQTLLRYERNSSLEVQESSQAVKHIMSISRELNGERDIPKLLDLILLKAREITNADAGSIYTVDSPTNRVQDGSIQFHRTQNHSIRQNLSTFSLPVNEKSIVGSACIHAVTINIQDLYQLSEDPEKNPFGARHDKTWDQRIGYQSHSMLTVPMFDISHNIIGVIQLINRKKDRESKLISAESFTEQVIPFDERDQEMAEIVAQQAGIALENANMHQNIQDLFDGLVTASVTAIEQRDPTTSGHSHRVAALTVGLAEIVNKCDAGPYKTSFFNADQIQEIRYASLLHDFGKLGVRENVLTKAKKLYPSELERLFMRFELIQATLEVDYLRKVIQYLQSPDQFPMGANPYTFEYEKNQKIAELDEYLRFINKANEPTVLEQGGFEKLKDIANLNYRNLKNERHPYLLSEELKALSVSRGSLTREEFAEIQSHVVHTYEFLRKIPWGKKLANVPQIAAKHHEKLDGSGYPHAAQVGEIPTQSRMMTIADIFDALTAKDRPYKKAVPVDRALDIIEMEVKGGKIDSELFKLFCEAKVYEPVLDPNFRSNI
ncbi:MAG: hypothetical protein RL011_1969 [Pseudomonadota bacterium]|jgi:HD-GYP domain-containing protein (c-di-GMP phosphodiesterase class II)